MKKIVWIVVISLVAALVVFTGCAPAAAPGEKPPIKIAVLGQEAGAAKPLGDLARAGAFMAEEEINAAGGILGGRMIQVTSYDEGYSAEVSINSTKQAIAEGAVAFVGGVQAGNAYAEIDVVKAAGLPYIIALAGVVKYTVPGFYDGLFRSGPSGKVIAIGRFRWYNQQGYKRMVSINFNADYPKDFEKWFDYLARTEPNWQLERIASLWFPWGQIDITPEITKAVAMNPDFIYATIYHGSSVYPAIKKLRELGYQGGFSVGWTSFDTGQMIAEAPELMEGTYSLDAWRPDPERPGSVEWAAAFEEFTKRKGYPMSPGEYSIGTYIGVKAFAMAMEKAGTTDKDAVVKALHELDWVTPRGVKYELLPGGMEWSPGMYIMQAQGGKGVIVARSLFTREDFGEPYYPPD